MFASVTAGVSIAAVLLGAEVLLRLNGFEPFRPHAVDADEPAIFEPHPTLGWVHRPGEHLFPPFSPGAEEVRMRFLADGSRATGHAAPAGRPSLVLVGGSFTEGFAVNDEDTFAWKLQARFPELAVRNFGTGGYGTHQSLLVLERLLEEDPPPRRVVYGYYAEHEIRNVAAPDWLEALTRFSRRHDDVAVPYASLEGDRLLRHPPGRYPLWPLGDRTATVAFFQDRWADLTGAARVPQRRQVTERLIRLMHRRCEERGTEFLVVFLLANAPTRTAYGKALDAAGVPWADCYRRLAPSLRVPGDGHPNGKLHGMWSRCIATALERASGS